MSGKQFRITIRWVHIVGAAIIGTYIYSPWSDILAFDLAVKAIIIPGLGLSGIALWQQPAVLKWLRGSTS
ncbi:MAG: hypothetical protein GYB64_13965 [Chloroflexi bacterium]|nr:hypothetical protein [Chloroflexota bacterium]